SVDGVRGAMVIGAGLALLVLLFFLRDLRSMLVIGISIPISVSGTFLLMYGLGLTLNLITFGGLALGVGMLVDNAIVILENIYRKSEEGLGPRAAAIEGSEEVAAAIIASTLTTIVVFVPVVFLGGFAAVFFRQMAMVVTSALVCSLIVSLTLVPVLASILLRAGGVNKRIGDGAFAALDSAYAAAVRFCIRHGVVVLLSALAALGAAAYLSQGIGTELLPEADESEVNVFARYPAGTSLDTTREAVERIEELVRESVPEAIDVLATVGSQAFWSTRGEESSSLRIKLLPVEERERSSDEIAAALRPILNENLPGMRVFSRAGGGLWIFRFLRGGEDRVRVEVRGYDLATADALAAEVEQRLAEVEGVADARAGRERGGGELRLTVDRQAASDLGLSASEVSRTVSTLVQGRDAALYREGGDEFRVRVRLSDEDRRSVARLLTVPVALSSGATVSLDALVDASEGTTPQAIDRFNQERIVTVGADLVEGADLGAVMTNVRSALNGILVPEGFSLIVAGESAEQDAAFTSLGLGIALALLLVFMVMAGQFESFVQPIIILCAVPFAGIGVVAMLLLTGTTLNLNSFMGCVVLVGVAVNNAIVLVDYANLLRRRDGYELDAAIIETARRRLRPILMTTMTTLLALAPVAIGGGTGAENQTPLARVVVGGIIASSVVTLFVVPVLYRWVSRLGLWWTTRRA
ncbi:MAG: HAE1 family hydrophobic/amphiphilic exporter-1, partial [Bradymonadia bacterium]